MFSSNLVEKLLSYKEYLDIQNQISKEGLGFLNMPNNVVISILGFNPFQQELQANINSFLNNIYVCSQNIDIIMYFEINNDKVYLNYKMATDNARHVHYKRNNIFGIVCYTLALSTIAILVGFEFKNQSNTIRKATLRLI